MRIRRNLRGALLALIIASPALATGGGFDGIYTFGDSLSDQGNLYSTVGIPRADYYVDGRFTNGKNWVDVLASHLDVSSEPSIIYGGNNFAYGGTRTDYNTVEFDYTKPPVVEILATYYVPQGNVFDRLAFPWTLNAQRNTFDLLYVNDPNALYVVFSGPNDLFDITFMAVFPDPLYPLNPILTSDQILVWISGVVDGIDAAIAAMVQAGAQEILVPNIPDLSVVPGIADVYIPDLPPNQQVPYVAHILTTQYNSDLSEMLDGWEKKVNIIPFDTFSLTNDVVGNPGAFGFNNAMDPCYTGFVVPESGEVIEVCDNPDEYVFWDREHPTAAFHALLAQSALAAFVPDMLGYLTLQLDNLDVQEDVKTALNKKLESASQKYAEGKSADAASKLEDFIEAVEAKQGKEIPEEEAASMIMRADKIIALLDAGH